MINLLFISNSKNIEKIRLSLQPLLKVRIDLVSDFDYGLKDVFEKRPATVFIQDHIAGVTGESVARHIQMLLGAGSPSFIFMHEGSTRSKPIKGLYEYLIDLSQPESKIVEEILASLKSLLGPQWEKIYIPPVNQLSSNTTVDSLFAEDGDKTEQLVTDLFSDMDPTANLPVLNNDSKNVSTSENQNHEAFNIVSSPHDQLAEVITELNNKPNISDDITVTYNELVSSEINSQIVHTDKSDSLSSITSPASKISNVSDKNSVSRTPAKFVIEQSADTFLLNSNSPLTNKPSDSDSNVKQKKSSDFVIVGDQKSVALETDELLRAFENNLKPNNSSGKYVIIAISVLCVVGASVWFINPLNVKSKLNLVKTENTVTQPRNNGGFATLSSNSIKPALNDSVSYLPKFIPVSNIDRSYSVKKPGWERYVDTNADYRVYVEAGKVKAIQVLGIDNKRIDESIVLTTLSEFIGKNTYQILSKERKGDILLERATIANKSDLLIYKKNNEIIAFVVSR